MAKGFSLIELIIVLTLMVAVATLAFPLVSKKLKKSKQKLFEQKIQNIVEKAKYEAIIYGRSRLITINDDQIVELSIDEISASKNAKEKILIAADGSIKRYNKD